MHMSIYEKCLFISISVAMSSKILTFMINPKTVSKTQANITIRAICANARPLRISSTFCLSCAYNTWTTCSVWNEIKQLGYLITYYRGLKWKTLVFEWCLKLMPNIRIEKKSDMNAVFDIQTYNINVRGNVPLPLVF